LEDKTVAQLAHEKREDEGKGYRKEGRFTFYTIENRMQREKIREQPNVQEGIHKFWITFQSVQNGGEISKDEFLSVELKMCKAMFHPNEFDEQEALRLAREDWSSSQAITSEAMNWEDFETNMWELVDIWVDSVDSSDYADILIKLYDRIAHVAIDPNGKEIRTWRNLEDIESMNQDLEDSDEEEDEEQVEVEDEANDEAAPTDNFAVMSDEEMQRRSRRRGAKKTTFKRKTTMRQVMEQKSVRRQQTQIERRKTQMPEAAPGWDGSTIPQETEDAEPVWMSAMGSTDKESRFMNWADNRDGEDDKSGKQWSNGMPEATEPIKPLGPHAGVTSPTAEVGIWRQGAEMELEAISAMDWKDKEAEKVEEAGIWRQGHLSPAEPDGALDWSDKPDEDKDADGVWRAGGTDEAEAPIMDWKDVVADGDDNEKVWRAGATEAEEHEFMDWKDRLAKEARELGRWSDEQPVSPEPLPHEFNPYSGLAGAVSEGVWNAGPEQEEAADAPDYPTGDGFAKTARLVGIWGKARKPGGNGDHEFGDSGYRDAEVEHKFARAPQKPGAQEDGRLQYGGAGANARPLASPVLKPKPRTDLEPDDDATLQSIVQQSNEKHAFLKRAVAGETTVGKLLVARPAVVAAEKKRIKSEAVKIVAKRKEAEETQQAADAGDASVVRQGPPLAPWARGGFGKASKSKLLLELEMKREKDAEADAPQSAFPRERSKAKEVPSASKAPSVDETQEEPPDSPRKPLRAFRVKSDFQIPRPGSPPRRKQKEQRSTDKQLKVARAIPALDPRGTLSKLDMAMPVLRKNSKVLVPARTITTKAGFKLVCTGDVTSPMRAAQGSTVSVQSMTCPAFSSMGQLQQQAAHVSYIERLGQRTANRNKKDLQPLQHSRSTQLAAQWAQNSNYKEVQQYSSQNSLPGRSFVL
jgi:hypothetical protein